MIYIESIKEHKIGDSTSSKAIAESLGWSILKEDYEVEKAYDGSLWEKGFAPVKPQEKIDEEEIAALQKYLNETDWYAVRYAETGVEIPEEVKQKRQEAREKISALREEKS